MLSRDIPYVARHQIRAYTSMPTGQVALRRTRFGFANSYQSVAFLGRGAPRFRPDLTGPMAAQSTRERPSSRSGQQRRACKKGVPGCHARPDTRCYAQTSDAPPSVPRACKRSAPLSLTRTARLAPSPSRVPSRFLRRYMGSRLGRYNGQDAVCVSVLRHTRNNKDNRGRRRASKTRL